MSNAESVLGLGDNIIENSNRFHEVINNPHGGAGSQVEVENNQFLNTITSAILGIGGTSDLLLKNWSNLDADTPGVRGIGQEFIVDYDVPIICRDYFNIGSVNHPNNPQRDSGILTFQDGRTPLHSLNYRMTSPFISSGSTLGDLTKSLLVFMFPLDQDINNGASIWIIDKHGNFGRTNAGWSGIQRIFGVASSSTTTNLQIRAVNDGTEQDGLPNIGRWLEISHAHSDDLLVDCRVVIIYNGGTEFNDTE